MMVSRTPHSLCPNRVRTTTEGVENSSAARQPCAAMRSPIAIAMLIAVVTTAYAEPLPVPKTGQCPSSYRESGGLFRSARLPVNVQQPTKTTPGKPTDQTKYW
jgi:hypothetical protein